jgi:tRNA(adenine34) deaminase
MSTEYEGAMRVALEHAELAAVAGEIPVGAVVICDGEIIAARHNERETRNDPTAHAEILALRDAANARGTWHLENCALVVTLEPCIMCAGALINSRIGAVIFGAADLKGGATSSLYNVCTDPRLNHNPLVIHGLLQDESALLLKKFFESKRAGN